MKALRKQVYTPYSSIRGTNPQNQTTFKGKGFPDRLTTNVVYSDSFILDPSAVTPTPYKTYRLTSGFDPDNSLGGGQPTYWDQLATVYSRYRVNGAKITATFSKSSTITANEGPYICGIECSDSTSLPTTNAGVLISTPNTTFRIVGQEDGSKSVVATYSANNTYPDFADGLQARMSANQLSIGTQTFLHRLKELTSRNQSMLLLSSSTMLHSVMSSALPTSSSIVK